jgi:DAPG hydrolase PhiG domain
MIDWWFPWAKRADLHYKIWFPGLHYANRVTRPSPEDALRFERNQDYGLSNPAFAPGEATAICT